MAQVKTKKTAKQAKNSAKNYSQTRTGQKIRPCRVYDYTCQLMLELAVIQEDLAELVSFTREGDGDMRVPQHKEKIAHLCQVLPLMVAAHLS
jgi:hypothetical protein